MKKYIKASVIPNDEIQYSEKNNSFVVDLSDDKIKSLAENLVFHFIDLGVIMDSLSDTSASLAMDEIGIDNFDIHDFIGGRVDIELPDNYTLFDLLSADSYNKLYYALRDILQNLKAEI